MIFFLRVGESVFFQLSSVAFFSPGLAFSDCQNFSDHGGPNSHLEQIFYPKKNTSFTLSSNHRTREFLLAAKFLTPQIPDNGSHGKNFQAVMEVHKWFQDQMSW